MHGLIVPFFKESAKHLYKLVSDTEYRRYQWLASMYGRTPRYTERRIKLHDWNLTVPDVASLLSAYKEIFVEEIYAFQAETPSPVILDCGANIGISVLYFKKLYPQSKITAFEADPKIFKALEQNIHGNGFKDVELINKAIWSSETIVKFNSEGADAGRINTNGDGYNLLTIPTVRLYNYLNKNRVDFLKLDIEGAEFEVLKDCRDLLGALKFAFVEFHSIHDKRQDLGALISLFEDNGFRVHIHTQFFSKRPFLGIRDQQGFDMRLNIFFWRDS